MTTLTIEESVQRLAQGMLRCFEQRKRDSGATFWVFRHNAPSWMAEAAMHCHDIEDTLPDDYVYAYIVEACEALCMVDSDSGIAIYAGGIVESWTDVYNHDLLTWCASHSDRLGRVEQAINEARHSEVCIGSCLMQAQAGERREVLEALVSFLQSKVESE
jgi:hypothetical protein